MCVCVEACTVRFRTASILMSVDEKLLWGGKHVVSDPGEFCGWIIGRQSPETDFHRSRTELAVIVDAFLLCFHCFCFNDLSFWVTA